MTEAIHSSFVYVHLDLFNRHVPRLHRNGFAQSLPSASVFPIATSGWRGQRDYVNQMGPARWLLCMDYLGEQAQVLRRLAMVPDLGSTSSPRATITVVGHTPCASGGACRAEILGHALSGDHASAADRAAGTHPGSASCGAASWAAECGS